MQYVKHLIMDLSTHNNRVNITTLCIYDTRHLTGYHEFCK